MSELKGPPSTLESSWIFFLSPEKNVQDIHIGSRYIHTYIMQLFLNMYNIYNIYIHIN